MTYWIATSCLFAFLTGFYWHRARMRGIELSARDSAIARLMEENRLLRRGSRP